jgi:hypothetical protein
MLLEAGLRTPRGWEISLAGERARRRSESRPAGLKTPKDRLRGLEAGQSTVYQIRIKGHLDDRWADACEGLTVTLEETGDTLLTVPVVDQAALYGLLRKLRDLGAPLITINPAGPDLPGIASKAEKKR